MLRLRANVAAQSKQQQTNLITYLSKKGTQSNKEGGPIDAPMTLQHLIKRSYVLRPLLYSIRAILLRVDRRDEAAYCLQASSNSCDVALYVKWEEVNTEIKQEEAVKERGVTEKKTRKKALG